MTSQNPSKKRKTRHTSGTKMSEYLGGGKELLASEVPSLRAALQKGLLVQEEFMFKDGGDRQNLTIRDTMQEVVGAIMKQWHKANVKFVPPVTINEKTLENKLIESWDKIGMIAKGKASKKLVSTWEEKLDRLVDITICRCEITLCSDPLSPCSGQLEPCKAPGGAHIKCICKHSDKLPPLELTWLLMQRLKVGEASSMAIAGNDKKETKRQNKAATKAAEALVVPVNYTQRVERDSSRIRNKFTAPDDDHPADHPPDQPSDQASDQPVDVPEAVGVSVRPQLLVDDENNVEEDWDTTEIEQGIEKRRRKEIGKRNKMPIPNTAAASVRFGQSATETAATASSFLMDLIAAGYLSQEHSSLAVDKCKVQRATAVLMTGARQSGEEASRTDTVVAVYFDARKDPTRDMKYDEETDKYHPRVVKETHVAVTSEPDGQYRYHFTPSEPVYPHKPAYMEAQGLYLWLVKNGIDKDLLVLGGDSTNSNSGWDGGAMTWVERMLNRKVYWVICCLHCNELLLRHVISKLDGKSTSKDGFSGTIGKLLAKVNSMERNYEFMAIPGLEELMAIPQDVVKNMSTDSSVFYQLGLAVRTGKLSKELGTKKSGNICHSRWLTTGEAILFLWVSHHGLEGELLDRLRIIATFVVQVYHHMYFEIKVKHGIIDGPNHVLTQLRLIKQQPKVVQDIVLPIARKGAWFAHSEAILLTLVSSSSQEDRKFAIGKILEKRGEDEFGDTRVRPRRTPTINPQSTSLMNLISWEKADLHEPVFTASLNNEEIRALVDAPFNAPYFPLHTQSTERAVCQVTAAAASVVGFEARDGYIRAKQAHRAALPKFSTKQDIQPLFKKL